MGLPLIVARTPGPDSADNRLPARMNMHVLDPHLLLALSPELGERLHLRRVGAQEL